MFDPFIESKSNIYQEEYIFQAILMAAVTMESAIDMEVISPVAVLQVSEHGHVFVCVCVCVCVSI